MTKVAVYGTLRVGQSNYYNLGIDKCEYLGQDKVKGTLYNLGGFPGYKPIGDGEILIDVFEVDKETKHHMDLLEGYDPNREDNNFYKREHTETVSGDVVWIYIFIPPTDGCPIIESGDWINR